MRGALRPWIGWTLAVLAGLGFLFLLLHLERESEERGVRLSNAGEHAEAVPLFRKHLSRDSGSESLQYNLGTSLLYLEQLDEAEELLSETTTASDSAVAARGNYNLGLLFLGDALAHPDRDSAEVLARHAATHTREALRRDPASDDARWNLAVAQRALDSLEWLAMGVDEEAVADSLQPRDPERTEGTPMREIQDDEGTPGGHFFTRGEREALAEDFHEGPLTPGEATEAVSGTDQSASNIVRRIFVSTSPNRWGMRGAGQRRAW